MDSRISSRQRPARTTPRRSRAKTAAFGLFLVAFVAAIIEAGSYALWVSVLRGDDAITLYRTMLRTSHDFVYDPILRRAMPKPETEIVTGSDEFTNHFHVHGIPPFQGGFYDDGTGRGRPYVALAIGDSMTQGVGAGEARRFGWVAEAETLLPYVDLVNLGGLAAAADSQRDLYDRVAPHLPHDLVVATFSTGEDYINIAGGGDKSDFTSQVPGYLPPGADIGQFLQKSYYAQSYDRGCEAMLSGLPVPFTWLLLSKLASSLAPSLYQTAHRVLPVCRSHGKAATDGMPRDVKSAGEELDRITSELMRKHRAAFPGRFLDTDKMRPKILFHGGMRFQIFDFFLDPALANRMTQLTADAVNAFAEDVRRNGKKFLLVVIPTKEEIYLKPVLSGEIAFRPGGLRDAVHELKQNIGLESGAGETYLTPSERAAVDVDGARQLLLRRFDPSITVVDLTGPLREDARKSTVNLYWQTDGHLAPAGYLAVAAHVCRALAASLPPPQGATTPDCTPTDAEKAKIDEISQMRRKPS